MAECKIEGLDELNEMLANYVGNLDEVMEDMVKLGAKEVKEGWRKSAEKHGHKDTGELIDAIDFDKNVKRKDGELSSYIYPRGKQNVIKLNGRTYRRKKPVRRAAIAFVLHYGHGGVPGSHWVDDAVEMSNEHVVEKLNTRWEEFLENGR